MKEKMILAFVTTVFLILTSTPGALADDYEIIGYTVTNCADSGSGSLRDAISFANSNPGTFIQFNIPTTDPGYTTEGGVSFWRIRPSSSLPAITANGIIIDGSTQTANQGDTNPQGPEVVIDGASAGSSGIGIEIRSANNIIKNLVICSFETYGIYINGGTGNRIYGCYLGLHPSGEAIAKNAYGIYLRAANQNIIGSTEASGRNVISGNDYSGISIVSSSNNNYILGNYIGTNRAGTTRLSNSGGGILIASSSTNTIGGSTSGERNIISGNNGTGIYIYGSSNNRIAGNYIGTDVNGTSKLRNGIGILISNSSTYNTIGGSTSGERNIISGNDDGIDIASSSSNNRIIGNYIGTDVNGTTSLGNYMYGVRITGGSTNNTIGGLTSGEGNIISGNTNQGISIGTPGTDSSSGNKIFGNYIGISADGTSRLPNNVGVEIYSSGNLIGSIEVGGRNVISGNTFEAIYIASSGTSNEVYGNYIGVNANATAALGNLTGIRVYGSFNKIGTTEGSGGNIISGNNQGLSFTGGRSNEVAGNYIGTNANGTNLGNKYYGVYFTGAGTIDNRVGPNNVIAYTAYPGNPWPGYGIYVYSNCTYEVVTQNSIYLNTYKGIYLLPGANLGIIPPTITSAFYDPSTGNTEVSGTIETVTCSPYSSANIEIFKADSHGQGITYLATVSTTEGQTSWAATISGLTTADAVTATVTKYSGSSGNTSEFATSVTVSTTTTTTSTTTTTTTSTTSTTTTSTTTTTTTTPTTTLSSTTTTTTPSTITTSTTTTTTTTIPPIPYVPEVSITPGALTQPSTLNLEFQAPKRGKVTLLIVDPGPPPKAILEKTFTNIEPGKNIISLELISNIGTRIPKGAYEWKLIYKDKILSGNFIVP